MCKFCHIFSNIWACRQVFVKITNTKLRENLSRDSKPFPCEKPARRTDMKTITVTLRNSLANATNNVLVLERKSQTLKRRRYRKQDPLRVVLRILFKLLLTIFISAVNTSALSFRPLRSTLPMLFDTLLFHKPQKYYVNKFCWFFRCQIIHRLRTCRWVSITLL